MQCPGGAVIEHSLLPRSTMSSGPEHFLFALCEAGGTTKCFWGRCQGKDKVIKVETKRLGTVTSQRFLWWWCYSLIQFPYFDLLCCWEGFTGHFCVLFLPSHTSHLHAIKSIWAKFSTYITIKLKELCKRHHSFPDRHQCNWRGSQPYDLKFTKMWHLVRWCLQQLAFYTSPSPSWDNEWWLHPNNMLQVFHSSVTYHDKDHFSLRTHQVPSSHLQHGPWPYFSGYEQGAVVESHQTAIKIKWQSEVLKHSDATLTG